MKNVILIGSTLVIFSCTSRPAKVPEKMLPDSTTSQVYEVHKDSIMAEDEEKVQLTFPGEEDTLQYARSEFEALKKCMLDESNGYILSPDTLYMQNEFFVYTDSAGRQKEIQFSCETCHDGFFETYAWFLKPRNGIVKYSTRRKKIIGIFRIINEIFGGLRQGGTYYGHQYSRILGYAEYAIYSYRKNKNLYSKNEDFAYWKKLYIDSLRQMIAGKINSETGIPKDDLVELYHRLLQKVSILDKQINDYFYLREAREFQIAHYSFTSP